MSGGAAVSSAEVGRTRGGGDDMAPSSAGSWERAADIIDLDRYMRGSVRPSAALSEERMLCEQLVVDGGGVRRAALAGGGGGGGRGAGSRYKQYSHDSGVSDGSYDQRAHRRSRRASNTYERSRTPRNQISARTFNGVEYSDSLRAFRTVCEQALLDQQKQIARVAQLCERLTERAANERLSGRDSEQLERFSERISERSPERVPDSFIERVAERSPERILERSSDRLPERFLERLPDRSPERIPDRQPERTPERLSERINSIEKPVERLVERPVEKMKSDRSELTRPKRMETDRVASDTSDISSSSRSTKDLWRKEKHRTQECKTYKIIMSKLDELNRRFSPRGHLPPRPPRIPSSSSVSVCDKLVATEPDRTDSRAPRPAVQIHFQASARAPGPVSPTRPRVVAQAYNVDIAPRHAGKNPNVATESVVKCDSSCGSVTSPIGDPRCNFDLEDPVHLYSQAKRLQALNASTRRTRSHSSGDPRDACARSGASGSPGEQEGTEGKREPRRARSPSLCSVCRGYWRSLRQCLVGSFSQDCKCS